MNVDRARFLLLTTALSAATAVAVSATGCSATSDTKDGGTTNTTPDTDSGTADSSTDAYAADGDTDGGACLDDTGLAATCDGVPADCSTICEHYLPTFKKGVARAITGCLVKLPTCEGAQVEIANCVQNALGQACPDPTAEDYCNPLSEACGGADGGDAGMSTLPRADCIDLAAGLNDTGRTAFTTCITEGADAGAGYCIADPNTCIDAIE
jgi:hypothetical protein